MTEPHIRSIGGSQKIDYYAYLDGAELVGLGGIRDALRGAAASLRTHALHSQRSDQSSNQC